MIVGGLLEGLGRRLTGRGTADNGEAAVGCFCVEWVTLHADVSILVSMPLLIYIHLNLPLVSANVKRHGRFLWHASDLNASSPATSFFIQYLHT
jgi:hypothetical protein